MFWRLLSKACYTDKLPHWPGEPILIDPWPKWKPAGTRNNTYVEPDLFIRFPDFDLIIEAKYGDECSQSPDQWQKELTAYTNEYFDEKVPVRMIALGGVWSMEDAEVSDLRNQVHCPVHMCKWTALVAECQRMEKELQRLTYHSISVPGPQAHTPGYD